MCSYIRILALSLPFVQLSQKQQDLPESLLLIKYLLIYSTTFV
jgi:hypothetical protein